MLLLIPISNFYTPNPSWILPFIQRHFFVFLNWKEHPHSSSSLREGIHCNSPKKENVTAPFCYNGPFCASDTRVMGHFIQFFMHRKIQFVFPQQEVIAIHGATFEKYPEASVGAQCGRMSNSGCPKKGSCDTFALQSDIGCQFASRFNSRY